MYTPKTTLAELIEWRDVLLLARDKFAPSEIAKLARNVKDVEPMMADYAIVARAYAEINQRVISLTESFEVPIEESNGRDEFEDRVCDAIVRVFQQWRSLHNGKDRKQKGNDPR
jgi:hypothetical protein